MKIDTTKVYYLGDLSDEQLERFNKMFGKKIDLERTSFISFIDNNWHLTFATTHTKTNALTIFDETDYRDIILDEETYYNLDGTSKEQYDELQNEYNRNKRFCIVDLQHKENEKEFKNVIDLFNNRRIISIQLRIQELNNELIELDEEMRKLTYEY